VITNYALCIPCRVTVSDAICWMVNGLQALIAANRVLYEVYKGHLKSFHARLSSNLAESMETYDRKCIVGYSDRE